MSLFAISEYHDIESQWKNSEIETMNLELKGGIEKDTTEVAKDISSFANAEGGVIIYGIKERNSRAVPSKGLPIGKNSERIQQIVSSNTAPEVPIEITVINAPPKGKSQPTKEFVVVKIPKSRFMIHQVLSTSKFYVRNNTITRTHVYNPIELKENDIALRYEARFRDKLNQESFIQKKESKIFKELKWGSGVIVSFVPHVRIPGSLKITKEMFDRLFVNKGSYVIYNDISSTFSIPSSEGRMFDPRNTKKVFVEIDNDRSIWCCRQIGGGFGIDMFEPVFLVGALLHIVDRIWKKFPYYGGMFLRIRVNGTIGVPKRVSGRDLDQGDRSVSDFEIEHELPVGPFDLKTELTKIFEKWFEALHLDEPLKLFPTTIPAIEARWKDYDKKSATA